MKNHKRGCQLDYAKKHIKPTDVFFVYSLKLRLSLSRFSETGALEGN